MTTLTLEDINHAAMSAAMCDDYTQHKKEMEEVRRLRAQYREENPAPEPAVTSRQPKPADVRRKPAGHVQCGSFEEAKSALNAICGA